MGLGREGRTCPRIGQVQPALSLSCILVSMAMGLGREGRTCPRVGQVQPALVY